MLRNSGTISTCGTSPASSQRPTWRPDVPRGVPTDQRQRLLCSVAHHGPFEHQQSSLSNNRFDCTGWRYGERTRTPRAPFRQPEWSALALYDAPDTVRTVHASFVAAGADYITTNTYAVVPFHIGNERNEKDGLRLLQLAVQLARAARSSAESRAMTPASEQQYQGVQILGSIPRIYSFGRDRPFHATVTTGDGKDAGASVTQSMAAARNKTPFLGLQTTAPRDKITTAEPETLRSLECNHYSFNRSFRLFHVGQYRRHTRPHDASRQLLTQSCLVIHHSTPPLLSRTQTQPRAAMLTTVQYAIPSPAKPKKPSSLRTPQSLVSSLPPLSVPPLSEAYMALRGNGLDALASAPNCVDHHRRRDTRYANECRLVGRHVDCIGNLVIDTKKQIDKQV